MKHTLLLNTKISEARRFLTDNNILKSLVHDVNDQEVGYILLDNINKALKHNLENYPVRIITNYHEPKPVITEIPSCSEIENSFESTLPENINKLIYEVSGFSQNKNLFLIGGLVRDLIRKEQNLDIDITLEDNAIDFAERLDLQSNHFNLKEKCKDFGTAKIIYQQDKTKIPIDLATTREEYYEYPGALPSIENYNCPIEKDLLRRDFTINAMAININDKKFGTLIDQYGGMYDIEHKLLRVMHAYSFIDDPTRILRGICFAIRFGYSFSEATEKLIIECLSSDIFDDYCNDRLKLTIKNLFNLNNHTLSKYIAKYDFLRLIHKDLKYSEDIKKKLSNINNNLSGFDSHINHDLLWLIYLAVIIHERPNTCIEKILDNLNLTKKEKLVITNGLKLLEKTSSSVYPVKKSEVYRFYEGYSPESIIIGSIHDTNNNMIEQMRNYLDEYSQIKINSNGNTLKEMGITPGPEYSRILKQVLLEKIDDNIHSKEDEIRFIKEYLNNDAP